MRGVHPPGPPQLEGHQADTLAISRNQVQLRSDQCSDVVDRRRWVIEYARASDVHMHDPVLQMEELGIERVHSLHGALHLSPVSSMHDTAEGITGNRDFWQEFSRVNWRTLDSGLRDCSTVCLAFVGQRGLSSKTGQEPGDAVP